MATRRPTRTARAATAHPDVLTGEQVAAAVQSFALLADPTRVRMLWALRDAELDVASLGQTAGCRPTVASQLWIFDRRYSRTLMADNRSAVGHDCGGESV